MTSLLREIEICKLVGYMPVRERLTYERGVHYAQ